MKVLARYYPHYVSPRAQQAPPAAGEETGYYYSDQERETHLRDYWRVLVKRMRYMLAVFCAVVGAGLLYSLLAPTLYSARATLKIEPQNPSFTGVPEVVPAQTESGPYDYYQTQFALLNGAPLAARVIKEFQLENHPVLSTTKFSLAGAVSRAVDYVLDSIRGLYRGPSMPQTPTQYELGVPPWLVGRYLKLLKVEPVRNTRLVELTFTTPDPRLSQQLANAHAAGFIQMIMETRFNLTQEARDFLSHKLVELREKLVKAENELNQFRQQHGVISLEKGENIVIDRLMDLNKKLTAARSDRIQAESLFQMTRNKNPDYLAQVLGNPLILQLKASLAGMETEKARLSSIYTDEHPRIQELNQQIGEAKKALNNEIGTIVRGIGSNYAAARAQEQALEAEAKKQQEAALNLKEIDASYAVLNEEVVVHRGLYDNVLKRLGETSAANDLAASNIQIIQRAELPAVAAYPNTMLNLIVSVILGFFLAMATAFFLEYMDATMGTPQQVWAAVSLATLGVVPHLQSLRQRYHPILSGRGASTQQIENGAGVDERFGREVVAARDQFSMIAESYRTIRTALLLSQAERPPKVILLTSPCPGEGKTVTTINLGISLAQSGKKVLAIDGDLRKGRCHQLLRLRNRNGLANVLAANLDVKKTIQSTATKDFYLLPRGSLPPNPADLLMSQRMCDVLNELRSVFDFIVIDSPPVVAVSDTAVLSALCDGVVLVLNGKKTTTHSAWRALERLDKVGARILGVILNGVDIRDPDYADYRSYYPPYYATDEEDAEYSSGPLENERQSQ